MVATSAETTGQGQAGRAETVFPVALGLGAIVIAFGIAFFPSIRWMVEEWGQLTSDMSHSYLVVAISTVLFVRAVPEVSATSRVPAWWALPLLLGISVVWLLAYVATVVAVQTTVLPAILLTAIVAAYGLKAARPLAFPVLFIYFALPAWEHLHFIFQTITVVAVSVLIRVADIPALVDGTFVILSSGSFEIAPGCSGLSFVIAGLALAVLYSHLFYTRVSQNVRLILLALAVAMIGNWIRVFTVIVAGYRTDMQSSLVNDHLTMGWMLFAALMVPVYLVARRIEGHDHELRTNAHTAAESKSGRTMPTIVAILTMIAGPLWALTVAKSDPEIDGLQLIFPFGEGQWSGPAPSNWQWAPEFAGPAVERVSQYGSSKQFVLVYTNLYLAQAQGKELVFSKNRVAGDWRNADLENRVAATVKTGSGLRFKQVTARNYVGNWLIWYRYQIGGEFEISDSRAKMSQALKILRGTPEAGVIAFAAPCRKSCDRAAETLEDFVDRLGHAVRVEYSRDLE